MHSAPNLAPAPLLPEEVLARRARLPLRPAPVEMEGRYVRLRPLELVRDVEALHAVSSGCALRLGLRSVPAYDPDEQIWRYMSGGPFARADELAEWLRPQLAATNGLPLCVSDASTGHPVGVACYIANAPEHLKIELGSIWYGPIAQRTHANLEATYRMLAHAFHLGYRRVEWKCDARNERSRRAALRMGFRFEGVQDSHLIIKGRSRDTAWFRILEAEWPAVKQQLEEMLYP